jgi:hypothetical protein
MWESPVLTWHAAAGPLERLLQLVCQPVDGLAAAGNGCS